MPLKPQDLEKLKALRGFHISRSRSQQARTALESYLTSGSSNDFEPALRDFLIDFLHLTMTKGAGVAMSAEKLKTIVDQAVELHSGEPSPNARGESFVVPI